MPALFEKSGRSLGFGGVWFLRVELGDPPSWSQRRRLILLLFVRPCDNRKIMSIVSLMEAENSLQGHTFQMNSA